MDCIGINHKKICRINMQNEKDIPTEYEIKVSRKQRNKSMWRYRKKMQSLGLSYSKEERCYRAVISDKKLLQKIERYCFWHNLRFEICNLFSKRSSDYRKVFFSTYPPIFKDLYFCAYCGRLYKKSMITIDHLYPVAKVHSNIRLQEYLQKMGASSVNDPKNLVPACLKCNQRKGTKVGLWTLRGKIGQHQRLWIVRWIVRVVLVLVVVGIVVSNTSFVREIRSWVMELFVKQLYSAYGA